MFGVVAVTNAFLPALRRSAHPRIVNVSSGTGSLTWATDPQSRHWSGRYAAYRSSKTALNALTVFYAGALAGDGIKVNALAPSLRRTDLNATAAASDGDPAEAAAGAVRLALLPDDGPAEVLLDETGPLVTGGTSSRNGGTGTDQSWGDRDRAGLAPTGIGVPRGVGADIDRGDRARTLVADVSGFAVRGDRDV